MCQLPLIKALIVDKRVAELQHECKLEGDFEGISILECVKQTKDLHWVHRFLHHCGISIEAADSLIRDLPSAVFSKNGGAYLHRRAK